MNTQKNNIITGTTATKALLSGIKTSTNAIKISYGARGANAIIEHEFEPYHQVANDCETILQSIQITDPYEKIGLDLLKELSSKSNKDSGDGRKTTCIIADSIISQGHKKNVSPIQLKKELDYLIPILEHNINDQKKKITPKEVHSVATIAGESYELGQILGEIYQKIGKDGIIIPEASGTPNTTTEYIDGIRFTGMGYLSSYMSTETKGETKAIYKNPTILVTKRKIEKDSEIEPLINEAHSTGKPLVIVTDDMDSGVASRLIATHRAKIAKILIIRVDTLWKNYLFEDFSKSVGATVVEESSGVTFKTLQLSHLGTCDTITASEDEVTIVGGADISNHIDSLTRKGGDDSKLRLSWLVTKTCILRLGANNESELSYKRLKCYDAIRSSQLALRDGVVAGGGVSLLNAIKDLPDTVAGRIIGLALKEPYKQILRNSGIVTEVDKMCNEGVRGGWTMGYNCLTGKFVDMFDEGIIDSSIVVKNAIRNAISLASTVLTGRILICLPQKTSEQLSQEALKRKGLRM